MANIQTPRASYVSTAAARVSDLESGRPSSLETTFKFRQSAAAALATDKLTAHQAFYLFVVHGLGAMIISGGINFAIAYGMYTTQDLARNPIRLFQLPNTLAGDAAVTIIIQTFITWAAEFVLVGRDLQGGAVRPIGFVAESAAHPLLTRFVLGGGGDSRSEREPSRARMLGAHLVRAGAFVLLGFLLCWPISVAILTTVGRRSGGDWVFEATWAPQVFKGVLGGILSLLTTPLMAGFWMLRDGWLLKRRHSTAWVC